MREVVRKFGMFASRLRSKWSVLPRIQKAATLVAVSLMILVTIFLTISPAAKAAVQVTTSTNSVTTGYSNARRTWFDGTRYWAAIHANSRIELWYSTDQTTWAEDTSARIAIDTDLFSVYGDATHVYLAYFLAPCVKIVAGTSYPSSSFSWGSAVSPGVCWSGNAAPPDIVRDSNGRLMVYYVYNDTNNTYYYKVLSTNPDDITSWGAGDTSTIIAGIAWGSNSSLSSGNEISSYKDDGNQNILASRYTDGTGWDTANVPIAKGLSGNTNLVSMASNGSNEGYLTYINSAGNAMFRKYESPNGAAGSKIDDADNLGTSTSSLGGTNIVRTSTGNLYAVLVKSSGSTCDMWKSTDNGATWVAQDTAHHILDCGTVGSVVIDSSGNIYAMTNSAADSSANCTKFSSSTDLYVDHCSSFSPNGGTASTAVCAVDTNGKLHLVYSYTSAGTTNLLYLNNISGSWSTPVTLATSTTAADFVSNITLTSSNIPEISYIKGSTTTLTAALGNANNATSFTSQNIDTTVNTTSGQKGSMIEDDASGNTWVSYIDASTNNVTLLKHNSGAAWSTWQASVTDSKVGSEPSLAMAGNMLYILYKNSGGAVAQDVYNVDTATWSGENILQSGTTLKSVHVRWAQNNDNQNNPLDYLYSDGTDIFYKQAGVWRAPVTLDSNSGNSSVTLSWDATVGNLYAYWIRGNTIYYKKGVSTFASANWDASPTTLYATGTNANLSTAANNNGSNFMPAIWTNGTASPYSVYYATTNLNHNSSPAAPTLSTPSSGATTTATAPSFTFRTTDADNDYLRYKINLYQSDCSTAVAGAPTSLDQTVSQTGWSGQDQQTSTAYTGNATLTSSTIATYTYQGSLAAGVYCWSAQAIDPGGTNTFGSASSTQLFTINLPPAVPTLSVPTNGAGGVPVKPQFQLSTTDGNADYVQYKIQLCSDNLCNNVLQTFDQTASQSGWAAQDANGNAAYTTSTSLGGSRMAVYQYSGSSLLSNGVYYCRAYAIDPAGANSWSGASSISTFTTAPAEFTITGGVNIL